MIKTKYIWLIETLCISALIGASASSCSEQEELDVSLSLSDTEITFALPEQTPIAQSRATWLGSGDFTNKTKGGGNFTLYSYAYDEATDPQLFINKGRGWYYSDTDNPSNSQWMMLDADNSPRTYYWPNGKKLDFFAYMPDKAYEGSEGYSAGETYVEVLGYTRSEGMKFKFDLTDANAENGLGHHNAETVQEFIYAYETGKQKQTEPVTLHFHHPFALINFKLKAGSSRMKIIKLTFDNIQLSGTFSTARKKWDFSDEPKQSFTAEINKRVPNDRNYSSYLSDWFVVLPQSFESVTLTLTADRDLTTEDPDITRSFTLHGEWEQGKQYTYIISFGDNKEDIYFNVEVETDWIKIDYEHNIDVQ